MYSWRALRTESIEDGHIHLTQAIDPNDVELVALYEDDATGLPMHVVDLPSSVAPLLRRLVDMLNTDDGNN
jgi:hypothetical protein